MQFIPVLRNVYEMEIDMELYFTELLEKASWGMGSQYSSKNCCRTLNLLFFWENSGATE
jgi:hypothetical protein